MNLRHLFYTLSILTFRGNPASLSTSEKHLSKGVSRVLNIEPRKSQSGDSEENQQRRHSVE